MASGAILNGIAHINHQRKGCLSILWYDDNGNQQHYWNQTECNKFKTESSQTCQFGQNCRFAHIDSALIQKLQANNQKVLALQQQREAMFANKQQNKSHIVHQNGNKPPFGNIVTTYAATKSEAKPSVTLKSGITFSPKKGNAANTNNKQTMSTFDRNISSAFNSGNASNSPKHKSQQPFQFNDDNHNQSKVVKQSKSLSPKIKKLKSYKDPTNKHEGISFTTTLFDANGESKGTFISTQDAKTSNSIAVSMPQQSVAHSNESYEKGKCFLMCPADESLMRLNSKQCKKRFEMDSSGNYNKYSLIKEYSKSNAGQKKRLKDVRCGSVLRLTMQYLMNISLHTTDIPFAHRFSFLEDRIRSIIKDVYVQHLSLNDKEATIELLETSIRFRVFSHLLICHMDEHINQQTKQFPASTQYESAFLCQNVNQKNESFSYSSAQNLAHLPNIFSNLFHLYSTRKFDALSVQIQEDEIEIYCLSAYHQLVEGALKFDACKQSNYQNIAKKILCDVGVPPYIRRHKRIQIAKKLIDAYTNMNNACFFKLYAQKLSVMEQAILYPILDHFRLVCIRKMCQRKTVRMAPRNLYNFAHFIKLFGFYCSPNGQCVDATDFLSWFGGFDAQNIGCIVHSGLSMDDFQRLKSLKDLQRFAARDAFLFRMEEVGLQRLFQSASFIKMQEADFLRTFETIEGAKSVDFVDAEINELFKRCKSNMPQNKALNHNKANNWFNAPKSASFNSSNHNNWSNAPNSNGFNTSNKYNTPLRVFCTVDNVGISTV